MAYATKADIDALYGVDLLKRIADRDHDDVIEMALVNRGIEEADAEIDAYLGKVYTVPITPTPPVLRRHAVNMTIYHIALDDDFRTAEMTKRYEMAIQFLKDVVAGKAVLMPPNGETPQEPVARKGFSILTSVRG